MTYRNLMAIYGLAIILSIPAWLTHIVYCLSTNAWGFLIAGAAFPPVGVIHGLMIWFKALF